jgi:predicted dehydrogenase
MTGVRIGIVGLGVRGRQWAAVFPLVPRAELAAVVEIRPDAGVPVLGTPVSCAPVFGSLTEALRAVTLDAVIIATPPEAHRADLETAAEHGLAIVCEKPLSEDPDEAVAMVRFAADRGVPLLVGMNFRFLPVVVEARRRVQRGDLGRATYATFTYLRNRASIRPGLNSYPATMPHPMLLEQSIHHLDLIRYVYGREVQSVAAQTWNPPGSTYQGDACVSAQLRMADGLHVAYIGTWVSGTNRMEFRWRTDFERGVMIQERQFSDLVIAERVPGAERTGPLFDEAAEPPQPVELPAAKPFVDDTAALLACLCAVSAGEEPEAPTGADHLGTVSLVHACAAAAASGATISVPDFAAEHGITADRTA